MAPSVSSLEKTRRRCHDEEKAALLQFKHSFASTNECYNGDWSDVFHQKRKLESWKEGGDCCSWEGVECGDDHHHVVGLHLSGSCLYGSVNSSNALFTLTHLQRLDLSYNDFNYSHIPSAIGNLSSLTHLNLSGSNFSGQIPQQHLSNITTMVSLDLSSYSELELHSLKGLVQHMSNLKHLHLSRVDLSSSAPPHDFLSNFSSLQYLHLSSCQLRGGFPAAIFNLPSIKMLDLSGNPDLRGYLPSFRSGSPLKSLRLSHTSFGGVLPPSIGNLSSLEELDIGGCNFAGDLPTSLGNLTQLVSLGANNFTPDTLDTSSLSWIGKLTKLTYLSLDNMDLTGLQLLNLSRNDLSGQIPSSFSNLTSLESLDLSQNQLSGHIPMELTKLTPLSSFNVSFNNLSGPIPQGNQFCTYDAKSYEGNPGLFIETWNKQCGNARSLPQLQHPPPTTSDGDDDDDDSEYEFRMKWIIILIGFVSGLVGGVIVGNKFTTRKHDWFVKTFARKRRG
ncbi:unnamed protein product [Cuscuta campestris]|uniref:Leucine-rich repeat-containing N-terminal plant-type domain-containing protein n=1 Tax=Cuscuta campestris TaxID=132261 RepID=A0A484KNU5_9ASTE|nr:unnamed protein product [Cuscuta campestris]